MRISQHARRIAVAGAAALTMCSMAQPARAAVGATAARTTPSFNGSVYAIAYRGDTVYVGGSFTSTTVGGRVVSRQRLAAFDARNGALLDWAPRADGTVRTLAVSGTSVFAAGDFTAVSGHDRDALARLDASSGAVGGLAHRIDGSPRSLTVGDGRLYLGGTISAVDGSPRTRLAAFSLSTGALDRRWAPRADDTVHSVAYAEGRVYVGGTFHHVNGSASTRLSAVNADDGSLVGGFRPAVPAVVNGVAADAAGVYVAMGGQGGRAAAFTSAGRNRWTRVFDGDVQAVAVLAGVAYVGGHFDRACAGSENGTNGACKHGSVSRVKLAAVNGDGSLTDWAPQANGVVGVRTIAVDRNRGRVTAGGDFTTIGGRAQRRFASFG